MTFIKFKHLYYYAIFFFRRTLFAMFEFRAVDRLPSDATAAVWRLHRRTSSCRKSHLNSAAFDFTIGLDRAESNCAFDPLLSQVRLVSDSIVQRSAYYYN